MKRKVKIKRSGERKRRGKERRGKERTEERRGEERRGVSPACWYMPLIPVLKRKRLVGLWELQASLFFIVRPARATQ
jgi:hypothetical protein